MQEIPKPPPKPEWDPEDEISLGESDVDSAPLITPKDDVLPPPKKASEPKTQAQALSIRGLAQTRPGDNGNGLEVDLIRDFGPDLLSRLSGSTNSTTRDAQSNGWPNARSMPPQATSSKGIQMKGRGFRKGLVSSEMHATLMARLSEEKSRSEATSPVLVGDIHRSKSAEKSEASLREHVLQVLKQRREQAAQTASTQSAKIGKAQDEVEATSGVLANSRASRTALLQSRLAAEKAAISPPILSPNDTRSQPAAETVKPSEPPPEDTATSAGDPAQRMAELRGRLAEQKAARIKA